MFFQGLDQAGFRIAGGWFSKMLIGPQAFQQEDLPFLQLRQHALIIFFGSVIFSFLVDGHESCFSDHGTGGPEAGQLAGAQVNSHRMDGGMDHLTGDSTLPD